MGERKEKEKREKKEREKAEREAKLQEKKQQAEEVKAKKEQERLNKQLEKEREKLEKDKEKQAKAEEKLRIKLEKELKQQEKLKKDEEAKAKKEQEKLAKLQKKEAEKIEKLKKEEEVRAKKENAAEAKRLNDEKVDAEKQEKQQKQEHEAAKRKQQMAEKQKMEEQAKIEKEKLKAEAKARKEKQMAEKQMKQEQEQVERQNKQEKAKTEKLKELFVEQELRHHKAMESQCNTLKKKKERDESIALKNAALVLEKSQPDQDQATTNRDLDNDTHSKDSIAFITKQTDNSPNLKLSSDSPDTTSKPYHDSNKLTHGKDDGGNPFIDCPETHDGPESRPTSFIDNSEFDQSGISNDHCSGENVQYQKMTPMNLADILATPDEENQEDTGLTKVTSSKPLTGDQTNKKGFFSKVKLRFAKKPSSNPQKHVVEEVHDVVTNVEEVRESAEDTKLVMTENTHVTEGEGTEKQSCIKRGVPKGTKPAPPVVAIKMVDLLGASDEIPNDQEVKENLEKNTLEGHEQPDSPEPTKAIKAINKERKEKEKREKKEREKAEREAKLQEKKQQAEEVKA